MSIFSPVDGLNFPAKSCVSTFLVMTRSDWNLSKNESMIFLEKLLSKLLAMSGSFIHI